MKKIKNNEDEVPRPKHNLWPVKMIILTFFIAAVFAFLADLIENGTSIILPIVILVLLIAIGCIFDVIGTAVASADKGPFIAMSSKKVRGAKECLSILKNADKVSNICNDVIGDICGVVSGAAAASLVVLAVARVGNTYEMMLSIFASALVSALTVGGKALGKTFAMQRSKDIVLFVGRFVSLFKRQDKK